MASCAVDTLFACRLLGYLRNYRAKAERIEALGNLRLRAGCVMDSDDMDGQKPGASGTHSIPTLGPFSFFSLVLASFIGRSSDWTAR